MLTLEQYKYICQEANITEEAIYEYLLSEGITDLDQLTETYSENHEYRKEKDEYDDKRLHDKYEEYVYKCKREGIEPRPFRVWKKYRKRNQATAVLAVAGAAGAAGFHHYVNHTKQGHDKSLQAITKYNRYRMETDRSKHDRRVRRAVEKINRAGAKVGIGGKPKYR